MFARRHITLTCVGLCAFMSLLIATSAAGASEKAPEGYKNAKLFRNGGPEPILATGTVKLVSETFGDVECLTTSYGVGHNQVIGSETRAAGEIEAWDAFNCTSPYLETLEAADKKQLEKKEIPCATSGATIGEGKCFTVFMTAELPFETEERTVRRGHSSLPWKGEVVSREEEGERSYYLRTGMHAFGESAAANNYAAESGTCYPTEEKVRGTVTPANWKAVPTGCMVINIVFPQIPSEVVVYGGQEPLIVNGAKNGLFPSRLEFAETGKLFSSEGSLGTNIASSGTVYADGAVSLELVTVK
jgi:hypothetical protein